ncbi:MAG: hypothetical protein HC890_07385, partial [Chloroflexaceae bacterium]|nr:hypothetical protein [Chloroflexaceae bacterium]
NDTALFTFAGASVTVDLAIEGPQNVGPPGIDTLISIENVSGSNFAGDQLFGNEGNNVLSGLAFDDLLDGRGGDDTLIGGTGNDTLIGGDGFDTAIFTGLQGDFSIAIDASGLLVTSLISGEIDTLSEIELLTFDDAEVLVETLLPPEPVFGSPDDDIFDAALPEDGFDGLNDLLFVGAGSDLVDATTGLGTNRIYGGSGNDETFAGTNDRLFAAAGSDILDATVGNGGNRLYGGAGEDEILVGSAIALLATVATISWMPA